MLYSYDIKVVLSPSTVRGHLYDISYCISRVNSWITENKIANFGTANHTFPETKGRRINNWVAFCVGCFSTGDVVNLSNGWPMGQGHTLQRRRTWCTNA